MKTIIILLILAIIIGCSPQLYKPAAKDPNIQQGLLSGRKLYVAHCGSCHYLHVPREFTAEGWQKRIDEMQVRAKISEEGKKLIFTYLTSYH